MSRKPHKECINCRSKFPPNRGQLYCGACAVDRKPPGGIRRALTQIVEDVRATPNERLEAIKKLESYKIERSPEYRMKHKEYHRRWLENVKLRPKDQPKVAKRKPEPILKNPPSHTSPDISNELLSKILQ